MALSNTPLISSPDYNHDYILYISASTVSVAGVLVQINDDDHEHVIYYISKNLLGPPLKYNHKEKLALAVSPRNLETMPLHFASHNQSHSRFQAYAILAQSSAN
jgi:hypothetical protein